MKINYSKINTSISWISKIFHNVFVKLFRCMTKTTEDLSDSELNFVLCRDSIRFLKTVKLIQNGCIHIFFKIFQSIKN